MVVKSKELHTMICEEGLKNPKSVFFSLTEKEKKMLSSKMLTYVFKKNEKIYNQGETPKGILYLTHGKAKITKKGVGGREQIVRMAGAHSFIGYRALFAQEKTYAAATTLEETSMIELPFECVVKVIHSNPNFAMSLLKSFATNLRFAENRTVTLTQKHIRGRLAESLLLLYEEYGVKEDGETIQVILSREDVAKLSNMTPSNAIRTLSTFVQEGVIALMGRSIKILDVEALRRISQLG